MLVLPRALINKYKALAELNEAGKAATPKGPFWVYDNNTMLAAPFVTKDTTSQILIR
jgi:hypothetical protein